MSPTTWAIGTSPSRSAQGSGATCATPCSMTSVRASAPTPGRADTVRARGRRLPTRTVHRGSGSRRRSADRADGIGPDEMLAAMRLASPSLPIGAFAYSQGLERAITRGWVDDRDSAVTGSAASWATPWPASTCRSWAASTTPSRLVTILEAQRLDAGSWPAAAPTSSRPRSATSGPPWAPAAGPGTRGRIPRWARRIAQLRRRLRPRRRCIRASPGRRPRGATATPGSSTS